MACRVCSNIVKVQAWMFLIGGFSWDCIESGGLWFQEIQRVRPDYQDSTSSTSAAGPSRQ